MESLTNICEVPAFLRVMLIFKIAFKIVCIIVPIIIIISTIISLFKPIISGQEDDAKMSFKVFVRRVIAGLVIGFLPTIIPYAISLTGENTLYEFKECTSRVTLEEIDYYTKIQDVASVIDMMSHNPSEETIEEAKSAIDGAKGYLKEDHMIRYLTAISDAEVELERVKKSADCEKHGGRYKNGYCMKYTKYERPINNNGTSPGATNSGSNNPGSTDYEGGGTGNGATTMNLLGGNFVVVNTSINVSNFSSQMRRNGVWQGSNSEKYGDKCLGFAYTHAWGLYSGTTNYNGDSGMNYAGASHFSTYMNDNLQDVLGVIYSEINKGRPVVLQVNGNKQGTSRHFVTVVGYNSNVTSASSLKATDLLIMDSWDAQLERMDQANSRFVTSGRDCHKDYTGYRIQYLKQ